MERHITSLSRRVGLLTLAAAGWTGYVWGTRAALLDGPTPWVDWARIGVSLAFALALLLIGIRCLLRRLTTPRLSGWILVAFGAWMAIAWVPEVIRRIAAPDETLAFRAVHVALAVVSLLVGSVGASYGRQLARGLIPGARS